MPTYHATGAVTLEPDEIERLEGLIEQLKGMAHPAYLSQSIGQDVRLVAEQMDDILARA